MSKLTQNKTDFRLYLDQAKLGDEGVCAFTQSLDGACHLSVLDLQSNGIHAAGVSCLADSICKGKIILTENKSSSSSQYVDITSSLYLSYNSLGLKGVITVAELIKHVCLMKFGLNLSRCQLTKVGGHLSNTNPVDSLTGVIRDIGQQLCQLPQTKYVTRLHLDDNNFNKECIHILVGFMHLCSCVHELSCKNCGITSDDLRCLFAQLSELKISFSGCSELTKWDLRNNAIDNEGVTSIIDHLSSVFPKVRVGGIFVKGNPDSIEMERRLREACKKVRYLLCMHTFTDN